MAYLSLINIFLSQFLGFLIVKIIDAFKYFKNKEYRIFKGFGLHIYCGMFGSGKTSSMVRDAYLQAKKYQSLTILTNMKIFNFPKHTKIVELENYNQIINCPKNTLILIDEISTVFNSRDWKTDGVPAALLGTLLQVRKENKMMYATAQRFQHVDSLIRQITFTVKDCSCYLGRWNIIKVFNGLDYENTIGNTQKTGKLLRMYGFIQTDVVRNLYDTKEMVEKMKKSKYITDAEALKKQSSMVINI